MRLIGPFRQLLPFSGLPLKGALSDDQLLIIEEGAILIDQEKILEVGKFTELSKKGGIEIEKIDEDMVCIPGLIDSHTHICFAGSRATEYSMKLSGAGYLEIAEKGGGIWNTVSQTRSKTVPELTEGILSRIERHFLEGVTTIEVKSGYGLNIESEINMLRAILASNSQHPVDLISTCLAAHIVPKDFQGSPEAYLLFLLHELLPKVKRDRLSQRVDIFIEIGAFSPQASLTYLNKAKEMGFALAIHGDQFSTGGSKVAIEVSAQSVDHLEASTEKEISLLAKSNVIPVALPGASLGLGCPFSPARKLLDAGCSLAIGSDWNPGSAPMGDLLVQAAILSAHQKLSVAETLSGITFRAAAALGLIDRGKLQPGCLADLIAFPTNTFHDILYHQGKMKPTKVWKKGSLFFH